MRGRVFLLPDRRGGTDDKYDTRRWDGWEIVSHKVILDKYLVVGGIGGELVIVDLISGKVSVHSDECSWRSCVYVLVLVAPTTGVAYLQAARHLGEQPGAPCVARTAEIDRL